MDDNSVTINGVTIDFSPLLVNGMMFAVYCETKEDALIFLRCFKKRYPERCILSKVSFIVLKTIGGVTA